MVATGTVVVLTGTFVVAAVVVGAVVARAAHRRRHRCHSVPWWSVPWWSVPWWSVPWWSVPWWSVPWWSVPWWSVPWWSVPSWSVPWWSVPWWSVPWWSVPWWSVPWWSVPWWSVPRCSARWWSPTEATQGGAAPRPGSSPPACADHCIVVVCLELPPCHGYLVHQKRVAARLEHPVGTGTDVDAHPHLVGVSRRRLCGPACRKRCGSGGRQSSRRYQGDDSTRKSDRSLIHDAAVPLKSWLRVLPPAPEARTGPFYPVLVKRYGCTAKKVKRIPIYP